MRHTMWRSAAAAAIVWHGLARLPVPVCSAGEDKPITIADLAPPEAVVVVGSDDASAMWQAFDRTGFRGLWDEPRFKQWFDTHSKEMLEDLSSELNALGITWDDLRRPEGAVGAAAWFANPDEPSWTLSVLVAADFGESAGEMDDTVMRAISRAKERGDVKTSESAHHGVDIHALEFQGGNEDRQIRIDDEEGDGLDLDDVLPLRTVHYARAGSVLLLSNDAAALPRAIDCIQGERPASIGEDDSFRQARSAAGEPHVYAVVLADPLRRRLSALVKAEEGAQGPDFDKMMSVLGLDAIRGAAMALHFDTDEAMMEQTVALLTDGKPGLLGLLDAPATRFDPPAFVAAGASMVVLVQFNFAGVIPLVNKVVESLPEDDRGFVGPPMQMATATFGPILANLGPEVWILQRIDRPLSVSSQRQVVAIKVRDAGALHEALTGSLPQLGLASRDFQGNQIWSPQRGGFIPTDLALGLGYGMLFVGPVADVEDAMRHAGAADNPKLADQRNFREAARPLGRGIGFGYTDFAAVVEWYEWSGRNLDKILDEQMEGIFGEDEPADDDERRWREDAHKKALERVPSWVRDPLPADLLRKHYGDSVMQVESTAQGFRVRQIGLRPRE